ncbi:Nuclear cap-binding protein complex, subunit CBP20 (RRM superfamily) [Trachipleistophora hominis]|uniref:Nuclear cap-binding protein subunit 2 n=1 Tax=Trachipleistophora hominis TaxID=72359 RepID=L7JUY4_TRAHO|nr:Nuclear cap-binding protein complex, subunit CBP20 (RRM superfamily) [Trachipleistophora hominis]
MQQYFPQPSKKAYRDRTFSGTDEQYEKLLSTTCTLYIGNLPLSTTEERLWTVFADLPIRRIIMGLNRNNLLFCGFAFVEFYNHVDCRKACVASANMMIDGRSVWVDMDYGFTEGRQWGRGFAGGSFKADMRKRGRVRTGNGRYYDSVKRGPDDLRQRPHARNVKNAEPFEERKRKADEEGRGQYYDEGKRRRR